MAGSNFFRCRTELCERAMSENYFVSEAFDEAAKKAVREAIAKADELSLPKAYGPAPQLPAEPVVVRIKASKKKI